jgi:integrase
MKMKEQHIVPLSRQSLEILERLKKISGNRQYIFPNAKNLHTYMSENAMLFALYRMGYHLRTTGHGFRSTASTVLNEHGFEADVIERQLAHSERNAVRAAYNHAQYLSERRRMTMMTSVVSTPRCWLAPATKWMPPQMALSPGTLFNLTVMTCYSLTTTCRR